MNGYAVRLVLWTLAGFGGVGFELWGGLTSRWPIFAAGAAVGVTVTFMLGSGRFLPRAHRFKQHE